MSYDDQAPNFIRDNTPEWNTIRDYRYQTYYVTGGERYGGPADTGGRTGWACNKCNPIYGLRVNQGCQVGAAPGGQCEDLDGNGQIDEDEICDNTYDDIFDDAQPIRVSKEAAKSFVRHMRAYSDQAGIVTYDTYASIDRELNCLIAPQRGEDRLPEGLQGTWDPVAGPDDAWLWCYDHHASLDGLPPGNQQDDETHGSMIGAIENMEANASTNIADGIIRGMDILRADPGHYGRPCAAKVVVLLTDGQPNRYPNSVCYANPGLWPPLGPSSNYVDRAKDCVIYYAMEARARGIVIHTIGLGVQADHALMQAVANRTGGEYFAANSSNLGNVMAEIANRVQALRSGLEVGQSVAPQSVRAGGPLTFTLALTNTGEIPLGLTVTDVLPATVTPTGVLHWVLEPLAPGAVWTQTLAVVVSPDHSGPLTNVVEMAGCITGTSTFVRTPGVTVTQQAGPDPVQPGEGITYTLWVTNTGDFDLYTTITDVLPVSVTPTGVLTWTPLVPAPGGVWSTTVPARAGRDQAGPIVNVVQVASQEGAAAAYTETTEVVGIAALTVTKQASSPVVQPGQMLTYTLWVTNTGDWTLHATITDALPASLVPGWVRIWSPTIAAPGGVWSTTVSAWVVGGYAGPLTNTVEVTTEEGASGSYTEIGEIRLSPGIVLTKQAAPGLVKSGQMLTYTIWVTNTGGFDLHATIKDALPEGVVPGGLLTWSPVIPASGGVWSTTVGVQVPRGLVGPLVNVAWVTTLEGPSSMDSETSEVCVGLDGVTIGGPLTGTLGVEYTFEANAIPVAASMPVTLTWEATDQAPLTRSASGTVDSVQWVWTSPGTKTITVTATNACGDVAVDTHAVYIFVPRRLYLPIVTR